MTRSILTALAASIAIAVVSGTGCAPTGIGDPCIPEQEYDPTFSGFDFHEVSTESKSFQCVTRLCLVNHFQGRVSCPYGQKADGSPVAGASPSGQCGSAGCCTPGIAQPVTGPIVNGMPTAADKETVKPQCTKRIADQAVYCSCRCQNINGATDDGAVYCACPDGFTCTQLVTAIQSSATGMMAQNEGLTGGYCVKNGTPYNAQAFNCTDCNPAVGGCGKTQGVNK